MMEVMVNGRTRVVPEGWRDEQLLWVLREAWGLVGAKFGCGLGQCGACTVLLDGAPQRSCLLPVAAAQGRTVTTVEGLADGERLHPLQQAWLDEAVPQCGYCQSGHLLAAAALLRQTPQPSETQIKTALAGHLCRCGSQTRMCRAIQRATRSS